MHSPVALIARALLLCVLALIAGNGNSYARLADIDTVKTAIAAYHAALGSLDPSKVDPLWAALRAVGLRERRADPGSGSRSRRRGRN
jgi:hypothetical protein